MSPVLRGDSLAPLELLVDGQHAQERNSTAGVFRFARAAVSVLRLFCVGEDLMAIPRSLHRWLALPSRIALILGLGALSTARASADAQANQTVSGGALIRSDGGKIYLSEGGRETELRLTATPQRDRLLRLLEEHGAAGVKLDRDPRLIMSSGGGAGFSLRDITKSFSGETKPAPQNSPQVTTPRSLPKQESGPRDHVAPTDKKG